MTFDEQDLAAQAALRQLKEDIQTAEPATLRLLLTEARTINTWTDQEVSLDTLKDIYEIMKMGPTSANSCPARLIFLKSSNAKERLRKALKPNNVDKTKRFSARCLLHYCFSSTRARLRTYVRIRQRIGRRGVFYRHHN